MTSWTIDAPRELTFEEVSALTVRIAAGHVDVVATTGKPRLEVSAIEGPPLLVEHTSGRLTAHYEDEGPGGLLRWLRPFERRSATISLAVPPDCPVDLGVASAAAVVSGVEAHTAVRSASGAVTLDGLSGDVSVQAASGDVEARGLTGRLDLGTVSGDLTVAEVGGERLKGKTVSGRLTVDLDVTARAKIELGSVSGDVAVRLPEDPDLTVDLRSVSGQVGAAFDGLTRRRQPGRVKAHGRIGSGSGRLTASTVSGDIALLRRKAAQPSGEPA